MIKWAGLRKDTRGTSSMELAILLPVVFLLGFGGLETARMVQAQQSLLAASRDAARQAARIDVTCAGNTGSAVGGGAGLPQSADIGARHQVQLDAVEIDIDYVCRAGVNNQLSQLHSGLGRVVVVRVTVSGTYVPLSGVLALPVGGLRLTATHEQVWTG
jgi:hypothetical protein